MNERAAREAILEAGARLGRRRLIAGAEGNLSVRLDDERLLVTPSGRRKDELRAHELLVVSLLPGDGSTNVDAASLRPTSDLAVHRAVLAARPDVNAVVHAHLSVSMALTLAGERPDPSALPETALLLPHLPVVAFGEMGSEELARRIAEAFAAPERPGAVLLERHGAVAVGEADGAPDALREAVDRLELVDVLCRVWRDAALLRAARLVEGRG